MSGELYDRAGHHALQASPVACDPADDSAPGLPVAAEAPRRLLDGALEHDRGAIVEGVRERGGWMDPLEPVLAEWQLAEERRRRGERVDRGAGVVDDAGLRQLGGPAAAADRVLRLIDPHQEPLARERDRRSEPVRP